MSCDVMRCHVIIWCAVISCVVLCHVMRCDVMWSALMWWASSVAKWCGAMGCDLMSWWWDMAGHDVTLCGSKWSCRCLASRWSSNTLAHRGCFQTYRGRSSVFCKFYASCACPSASAFRMPARARRRLRCALLRSASHERNAVSRRVASSWSCQVDFNLSLCFFWRHSPKKLYGRLRTRVRSWALEGRAHPAFVSALFAVPVCLGLMHAELFDMNRACGVISWTSGIMLHYQNLFDIEGWF